MPGESSPGERLLREIQFQAPRLALERRDFLHPEGGASAERPRVMFGFIAKHRGVWPFGGQMIPRIICCSASPWMCGALGVSRSGFFAWLNRAPSARAKSDDVLGAKVRASFLLSDRTYGARRVWHGVLADGLTCGLHRIECLMHAQALKARPRRRRLQPVSVSSRIPSRMKMSHNSPLAKHPGLSQRP